MPIGSAGVSPYLLKHYIQKKKFLRRQRLIELFRHVNQCCLHGVCVPGCRDYQSKDGVDAVTEGHMP